MVKLTKDLEEKKRDPLRPITPTKNITFKRIWSKINKRFLRREKKSFTFKHTNKKYKIQENLCTKFKRIWVQNSSGFGIKLTKDFEEGKSLTMCILQKPCSVLIYLQMTHILAPFSRQKLEQNWHVHTGRLTCVLT